MADSTGKIANVPGVRLQLTVAADGVLALESLVFIGVHVKYRELASIVLSGVLGLIMAFIAYGRLVLCSQSPR